MKRLTLMVAGAVTILGLTAGSAFAVPAEVAFTARVSDGGGPINGTVNLGFELYDAATNGTATGWTETYNGTSADNGLVYVSLGSQSGLDETDFDGSDLWLEITVNGAVQAPRLAIQSVPYSIRAATADTLGGLGPGDVALSSHDHAGVYAPTSHTHSYAPLSHTHSAADINAGTLNNARFSAYSDLSAEGYLDLNAAGDLVTRTQGDGRYAALSHTPAAHNHNASNITAGTLSTSRYDSYSELTAAGRIGSDSTDLPTISIGDTRWGGGGDAPITVTNESSTTLNLTNSSSTCNTNAAQSVSITVPAAGTINLRASAWIQWDHTTGTQDEMLVCLSSTAGSCNTTACGNWDEMWIRNIPASYPSDTTTFDTATVMRTVTVAAAGTYTYYLGGYMAGGYALNTDNIWWANISATWHPN